MECIKVEEGYVEPAPEFRPLSAWEPLLVPCGLVGLGLRVEG